MNEDSMHTFSTFVAHGTIIVNTALLIIGLVLEQICQCALPASRKGKGQDSEGL